MLGGMSAAAPPPLPVRVCPRHGLVVGRDGRCVICHRDDNNRIEEKGNQQILAWTLGIAVVMGGAFMWRTVRQIRAASPPIAETDAPVRPPPPPPEEPEPEPTTTPEVRTQRRLAAEKERQRDIEADMRRVRIKMFMVRKCEMCDAARDHMKAKGMTFQEIDVDDPGGLADMRKLTPSTQVPVFDVEGEVLVGFAPTLLTGAVRRAADKRNPRF